MITVWDMRPPYFYGFPSSTECPKPSLPLKSLMCAVKVTNAWCERGWVGRWQEEESWKWKEEFLRIWRPPNVAIHHWICGNYCLIWHSEWLKMVIPRSQKGVTWLNCFRKCSFISKFSYWMKWTIFRSSFETPLFLVFPSLPLRCAFECAAMSPYPAVTHYSRCHLPSHILIILSSRFAEATSSESSALRCRCDYQIKRHLFVGAKSIKQTYSILSDAF